MVNIYCVRDKKHTPNVPNTEQIVLTKNNRTLMKAQCALCGITKSRFISNEYGKGFGQTINKKIGEKVPGFQQAQDLASGLLAVTGGDKDLFKKYWSGDIAKGAFNTKTGLFSKKFWTHPSKDCVMRVVKKNGKWHNTYDC